ncbi:LCP family protein [Clostridium sp.]|uniref:LCP family protein n=1 Tax=Clostridium sp. TaxID=1506 RepID=UPI0034640DB8
MKKRRKIILISFSALLGVIMIVGVSYYMHIRSKIYNNFTYDIKEETYELDEGENKEEETYESEEEENNEEKQEVSYDEIEGITNILLVGIDARDINEPSRSDAIIIATIDNNNKNLKFTSIMRDSYVEIKGLGETKINAAYAKGGVALLIDTIERNFNLKLDKYVVVNFFGFQDIVDALGGVEVDIKDYEVEEINKYIGEVNESKSPKIEKSGINYLDGQGALAYTRIRNVGDGSYERTKRQREVMKLIAYKLKDISLVQYPYVLGKISNYIKTNIEPMNMINYGYTVSKFDPLKIEQLQIPVNELSYGSVYKGSWVILMDKKQNSNILLDFILNNKILDEKNIDKASAKKELDKYLKVDNKDSKTNKKQTKVKNKPEVKPYNNEDSFKKDEYDDYDAEEVIDFE